ncbi:MAG: hypothetical protein AAFR52_17405, partial [Pseudomonadota bacterium]
GGAGDDELRGGPGPDILQGDGGADLFVLVPGDFPAGLEVDFIEDFEPGTDRVSLLGFGFTDFSQLTWQSTADGIAANLGNSNFLVFSGFADETGFSAADFILDPPAPSSAAPAPMAISGFASIAAPSAAASRAASAPVEDEAPALLLEAPVEAEGPAPLQDAPVAEEVPVVTVRVVEENPAPVAAVASMASHRAPGEPIVTEPAQVVFAAQPLVAPEATVLQVGPVEMVSEIALAGPVREDAAAAERTGAATRPVSTPSSAAPSTPAPSTPAPSTSALAFDVLPPREEDAPHAIASTGSERQDRRPGAFDAAAAATVRERMVASEAEGQAVRRLDGIMVYDPSRGRFDGSDESGGGYVMLAPGSGRR